MIGEGHHRSTIPDAVVVEIRDLYEYRALSIREIMAKLAERGIQVRYRTVRKIVNYERRAQVAVDYIVKADVPLAP